MSAAAVALIALLIFVWGLFSVRLGRADLSAPIVFVGSGFLLSGGMQLIERDASHEVIRVLAEVTLVWVLFSDAARIRSSEIRADAGLYGRLLLLGLPLTIIAGTLLALVMFDGMGFWSALVVGAALAPTDAALGANVMTNPAVPERVRRLLNVESGLNDGIATPIVSVAIAGAAAAASIQGVPTLGGAFVELAIGLAGGVTIGAVGGRLMRIARRRGWASDDFAGPAVLALALVVYAGTMQLGGNGFVAAFLAGLAFGNSAGRGGTSEVFYVEQTAGLASLLTWLLFGAIVVPDLLEHVGWQVLGYAVLSLTLVRMLPVAVVLVGSGLNRSATAFVGWFGPRGLASIIFALLALEELDAAGSGPAVELIGTTVLLSVFAHGLSAKPLAGRSGASLADSTIHPAGGVAGPHLPVRRLVHHQREAEPPQRDP